MGWVERFQGGRPNTIVTEQHFARYGRVFLLLFCANRRYFGIFEGLSSKSQTAITNFNRFLSQMRESICLALKISLASLLSVEENTFTNNLKGIRLLQLFRELSPMSQDTLIKAAKCMK